MTLLSNRKMFSLLTGLAFLLVAGAAAAQSNPTTCTNDDDCIATPECGGDVCEWSATGMKCKPAGGAAKGADGWCTTDDDCKCKAMGATCVWANSRAIAWIIDCSSVSCSFMASPLGYFSSSRLNSFVSSGTTSNRSPTIP